jgi:uncharacterized protein (TIGR02391 family)
MIQDIIEPFKLSALERLSQIIANRYSGTQITLFFYKCGFPKIQHDGSTKSKFVFTELQKLQGGPNGAYSVAKVVEQLCDPQEFHDNIQEFHSIVESVNEVLSFYNMQVNDSGKIIKCNVQPFLKSKSSEDLKLFDSRMYHSEVKKHARGLFLEGNYFHAVFECCKAFDKYVSEKSELEKHGFELMSATLSLKGCLKLNSQRTETECNEQEGLMHLCMGLMRAIRNPQGHEPKMCWEMTREDALDVLSLISYLYRKIDTTVLYSKK